MNHINFNSGGIGSWATLGRIIAQHGATDVVNLFTDTLIEDRDLYRFLIETTAQAYGIERPDALLLRCNDIPDISTDDDVDKRKSLIPQIAAEAMRLIPGLVWLIDGRTPWDVFRDSRYLGNSRLAPCSHVLKQQEAVAYLAKRYPDTENTTLYLGIDWTEAHRTAAPVANWAPYRVEFPMCEEPYVDKHDMLRLLDTLNIARPRLYGLGFAHNNCGGFCARGGHGHFANLYAQFPEYFAYSERKENEMRAYLGRDVSMMKKGRTIEGKRVSLPYTLAELRADIEKKQPVDMQDIGGCGCFVTAREEAV